MITIFNNTKNSYKDTPIYQVENDTDIINLLEAYNYKLSYIVLDISFLNIYKDNNITNILLNNLNSKLDFFIQYIVFKNLLINVFENMYTISNHYNYIENIAINTLQFILNEIEEAYITIILSKREYNKLLIDTIVLLKDIHNAFILNNHDILSEYDVFIDSISYDKDITGILFNKKIIMFNSLDIRLYNNEINNILVALSVFKNKE